MISDGKNMKWSKNTFLKVLGGILIFIILGSAFIYDQFPNSILEVNYYQINSDANTINVNSDGEIYVTGYTSRYSEGRTSPKITVFSNGTNEFELMEIDQMDYFFMNNDEFSGFDTEIWFDMYFDSEIDSLGNLCNLGVLDIFFTKEETDERIQSSVYSLEKNDKNGTNLWKKDIFTTKMDYSQSNLILDETDNIFLIMNDLNKDLNILKMDKNGNLIWNNTFDFGEFFFTRDSSDIDSNGNLFIVGKSLKDDIGLGIDTGLILKIDQDGNLVSNNLIIDHNFNGMIITGEGEIITRGQQNGNYTPHIEFIKWESDFSVNKSYVFELSKINWTDDSYRCLGMVSDSNGRIITAVYNYGTLNDKHTEYLIIWGFQDDYLEYKKIAETISSDSTFYKAIAIDSQNNIYTAGRNNWNLFITKWDTNFNKIWDKTWISGEIITFRSPFLENQNSFLVITGFIFYIALVIVFFFTKKKNSGDSAEFWS